MTIQRFLRAAANPRLLAMLAVLALGGVSQACAQTPAPPPPPPPVQGVPASVYAYPPNSDDRPMPPVVTPPAPTGPVAPPSDAVVLFDGHDLSKWASDNQDGPAPWKVENGYFEVVPRSGGIHTKQGFGDVQLHVEWSSPNPPRGTGQDRGNSGVFLQGLYEFQVLDAYDNQTYADGIPGAVYGQYAPLVSPTRKPGEWNTYDIVFHRPRFDAQGKLAAPARATVFLNGVLVQDDVTLTGPTAHHARPEYKATPARLPLGLQDHGHPVRYRSIWVRELEK